MPNRIERELMRGAGPVAVLKLLGRREMYGYELVEQLAATTEGVLDMGQSTLYPMLYNLEAKGLIKSTWRDSDAGRKRRYYTLTAKGRKRLSTEEKQWRSLAIAMGKLGILDPASRSGAPRLASSAVAGAQP